MYSISPDGQEKTHTIIVKREDLTYSGKECKVLNFTDITMYKQLKQE